MFDWTNAKTVEGTRLFNNSNPCFGGDWNGYDATQAGVVSKFNVVYAYALQQCIRLLKDGGVHVPLY
jgi:hypothetical protein